ncbi:MAG TPA: sensor histidine kinase [Candidatus Limnocylindrales bacterium]
MSEHAAIAPAATVTERRLPVGRMVLIGGSYLAIVIAAAIYPFVSPLSEVWRAPVSAIEKGDEAVSGLLWLAVLLATIARQPGGRLGTLIFVAGMSQRIGALQYIPHSFVWSLARVIENVGVGVFAHLILAFPTGLLRGRFDRSVVGLAYALGAAWAANELLFVGDWFRIGCNPDCVQNVFVILPDEQLYNWFRNVITVAFCLVELPLLIVGLWRHWRAAAPAARRTLLPLVVGVPLWLAVAIVEVLSRELDFAPGVAFFDSPSGRAIHLIVPLVFPAGLLLVILRARMSRGRVASLVVELGRGVPVGGLRDVLARALDDQSLQLAFAAPSGSGFVDAAGQPTELPVNDPSRTVTRLERDDELLGVLVHDPAIDTEDPGLVEAVGNAARMALENERLAAEVRAQLEEVRASRARIVEAADAERRRVERDLHDGAQQRLVALALRLEVAKKSTPGASELLDQTTDELQTAIGEVRGLARGVHPTILTEAGLRAAVEALAERTPVAVAVDIPERHFDPQIEATAYFVVAEALTNVARYAEASQAQVTAAEDDGRLVVSVVDDGKGGADPTAGSGLRGLADRLAALDGQLTVSSPDGGGTLIRAELPIRPREAPLAGTPSGSPDLFGLARVRAVPEVRVVPGRPGRVRLSSPLVLIAIVAITIAAVAFAAAWPATQPSAPFNGRADTFMRPFVYQVPAGMDIRLYPDSERLHVLSPPGRDRNGISIWAVDEVLVDTCPWKASDPPPAVGPREPRVEGLLAYLNSVNSLKVDEIERSTIDGFPAVRVDLSVGGDTGCPRDPGRLILWRDTSPSGEDAAMQVFGNRVPVILVDVDGETIAMEIWSGANDDPIIFDPWIATANRIIDSIRFFHRPSASPSPASSIRNR